MMTKKELDQQAEKMDIAVYTYSPGDGVTRYRFSGKDSSYFASDGIATVLGLKEANTWLCGYTAGFYNRN